MSLGTIDIYASYAAIRAAVICALANIARDALLAAECYQAFRARDPECRLNVIGN